MSGPPPSPLGKGKESTGEPPSRVRSFLSGIAPINATHLADLQPPTQMQTAALEHEQSALRSTINPEADAADSTARALLFMHRSGPAPATPSGTTQQLTTQATSDFDDQITSDATSPNLLSRVMPLPATSIARNSTAVAQFLHDMEDEQTSEDEPTTAPPPRQPVASFQHAMAGSSNDPGHLPPLSNLDSNADEEEEAIGSSALKSTSVDRSDYFPHNFDYATVDTGSKMLEYFNPKSKLPVIHPDDLLDDKLEGRNVNEKIRNLRKLFLQAAKEGYDKAPTVDHDAGTDQGTADDNDDWSDAWEKLLKQYAVPVVKGALTVGYRVAKREQLFKDGRGHEFFVCPRDTDTPASCTSQQSRHEAVRTGISDYFGRNKMDTKINNRMPTWCRKHYQKDTYDDALWQLSKRYHIKQYLDALEQVPVEEGLDRLTFNINLIKKDQQRIVQAATKKGDGSPAKNHRHPQDLDVIQHIHDQYVGTGKSREDCERLVDWAHEDFLTKLEAWKEEKTEDGKRLETVNMRDECRKLGPKHAAYEMVPEWKKAYGAKKYKLKVEEVKAKLLEAREKKDDVRGPVSNTPKRDRNIPKKKKQKRKKEEENHDDDDEEESEAETPSKKPRKK